MNPDLPSPVSFEPDYPEVVAHPLFREVEVIAADAAERIQALLVPKIREHKDRFPSLKMATGVRDDHWRKVWLTQEVPAVTMNVTSVGRMVLSGVVLTGDGELRECQ